MILLDEQSPWAPSALAARNLALATGWPAPFVGEFTRGKINLSGEPPTMLGTQQHEDPKLLLWGGALHLFANVQDSVAGWGVYHYSRALTAAPDAWALVSATPVLSALGGGFVAAPLVLRGPGEWRLYYNEIVAGKNSRCLATAPLSDAIPVAFTRQGAVIVPHHAGLSDWCNDGSITTPADSPDGAWHCVYSESNAYPCAASFHSFGARSSDGVVWTDETSEPIPWGASGFDARGVLPIGQIIRWQEYWYVPYQGFDQRTWRSSWARTRDFLTFEKCPVHGVLREGAGGAWDGGSCENPGVLIVGNRLVGAYVACSSYDGSKSLDGGLAPYLLGHAESLEVFS